MNWHTVRVFYRTLNDCKSKYVTVQAEDGGAACQAAFDKVRNQRGVYKLDTAEWCGLANPPDEQGRPMTMAFNGPAGVQTYRAITLKHALAFYAKHRMKVNSAYTPGNMLRVAGEITGNSYKRGQYAAAINDLDLWIQQNGTSGVEQ